jgi:hypothetical protein
MLVTEVESVSKLGRFVSRLPGRLLHSLTVKFLNVLSICCIAFLIRSPSSFVAIAAFSQLLCLIAYGCISWTMASKDLNPKLVNTYMTNVQNTTYFWYAETISRSSSVMGLSLVCSWSIAIRSPRSLERDIHSSLNLLTSFSVGISRNALGGTTIAYLYHLEKGN